ncbi:MAG: Lrp/AsnC family transcriptional regulator [Pseudomonadota bacterium]
MAVESTEVVRLDAIDRNILRILIAHGRISNAELAERVGLSPSPCAQRVRRLEAANIISGYSANLNLEALGINETVMIEVSLDRHGKEVLEEFSKAMSEIPEVLEVHLMAGEFDYLLKVAASSTKGVEQFLREHLFNIPGIRHSRTCFSLRCIKDVGAFVPD